MKRLREALLLSWLSTSVQGQSTRHMVFPLPIGRQWYTVLWRRKNRSARLQQSMVSLMKRSVASFVLLRKSMH